MKSCFNCQSLGEDFVEVVISKAGTSLRTFLCSDSCLRAKHREGYEVKPWFFDTGFSDKFK